METDDGVGGESLLEDRMANGCRCESPREGCRGGAGRQRKKESLFKDGESLRATTDGGGVSNMQGGLAREAWPRLHQRVESHHQCR